jgi:SAM-dependent methyltransferase
MISIACEISWMGNEISKTHERRLREGYFDTVFVGRGIDIGCGDDPVTSDCIAWDKEQGDAQLPPGIPRQSFDWVYSSHCLEDLPNPKSAIRRWWEVLKPGGSLLVVVPDEDLYEQGIWPSQFNHNRRWTFTTHKSKSWSPCSLSLAELAMTLPGHQIEWIRKCDAGYDYSSGVWDRTATPAEAHIELLVRKLPGKWSDSPHVVLYRPTESSTTVSPILDKVRIYPGFSVR